MKISELPRVAAGFPSPAESYMEAGIDLNKELIRHPSATYFVRVEGDSMIDAGIFSGDVLIVDKALKAKSGDVVIAILHGEFTVKRLEHTAEGYRLLPENTAYPPIPVPEGSDFAIWGVVVYCIHRVV
ncbi:MAG TPA: peptidase S24 [Microscillaceae bacterium]|jgi:DNA polymerase V|nr:peptidase S24 [Microscillaceae bacterium]